MKRILIFFVLGLLLLGCTQQTGGTAGSATSQNQTPAENQSGVVSPKIAIHIANFAFNPAEVTVKQGGAVEWINDDSATHTIKMEGVFESPPLEKGGKYTHTLNTVGEYSYSCGIHPSMHGKVIVTK